MCSAVSLRGILLVYRERLHWWLRGRRIHLPVQQTQVQSLDREDPLEKKMRPTPVPLSRKPHGQRSLVSYSPWGCKRVKHDLATKTTAAVDSTWHFSFLATVHWLPFRCIVQLYICRWIKALVMGKQTGW